MHRRISLVDACWRVLAVHTGDAWDVNAYFRRAEWKGVMGLDQGLSLNPEWLIPHRLRLHNIYYKAFPGAKFSIYML
jgi:hypothetical protein